MATDLLKTPFTCTVFTVVAMKTSYYQDILRGRSQELPDVRSKVVRVFVSSTFTGERTARSTSFVKFDHDLL